MDIYEQLVRWRHSGRRAALATIVRRIGSTPRKDHAKMLICDDGSTYGTVGGGCTEAEVWRKAQEVMETGRNALVKFELTQEDAGEDGLICGGTVEIFIEPVLPDPKLVIMGAGHLGRALADAAHPLGFKVAVVDDRAAFANSDRFPHAEELVVDSFERSLDQVQVTDQSFLLIVTRGHSHDQLALEKAIQTPARYVGLVGSRRKIQLIVEALLDKGYPIETFSRLYAPIGLDIGSETPEEIAVAVMAELIALRKGVHQRSEKQKYILRLLQRRLEQAGEPSLPQAVE